MIGGLAEQQFFSSGKFVNRMRAIDQRLPGSPMTDEAEPGWF